MLSFIISVTISKGEHVFICLGDIHVSFSVNPHPLSIFPLGSDLFLTELLELYIY